MYDDRTYFTYKANKLYFFATMQFPSWIWNLSSWKIHTTRFPTKFSKLTKLTLSLVNFQNSSKNKKEILETFFMQKKNYSLHIFKPKITLVDMSDCQWKRGYSNISTYGWWSEKGAGVSKKSVLGTWKTITTIFNHVRYLFLFFFTED